ncbi:DNA repair and recombination protein RadB [Candidatus Woesearchaeota archaeon]|nr:DNA repair and recombination protein RadB [Candidatus Woesearchaeota archaeon]
MIPTGSEVLDKLLAGGFEPDVITTIYGPSSTGKTCLCLQAALTMPKKVIYIDTEGGFSAQRAQQLREGHSFDNIILFSPTSFEEQQKIVGQLHEMATERVGLIIIDSIAMLYRLEMHKADDVHAVNHQLGLQLAILSEITRKKQIPVLLTNQVYARFDDPGRVLMVGGDLLKYSSKCLIELQKLESCRKAVLHKHRSLPEATELFFEIRQKGAFLC